MTKKKNKSWIVNYSSRAWNKNYETRNI